MDSLTWRTVKDNNLRSAFVLDRWAHVAYLVQAEAVASDSFPPRQINTAYYKNADVDGAIRKALATTHEGDKARLYAQAQKQVWNDAPWVFLVTPQLLALRVRNLTGFMITPDGGFHFDELDLK